MDPKPRQNTKQAAPKPGSVHKRGQGIAETARLFLDVDEMIRRSQTVSLSRYIE
jgi:hypothetical protein